MKKIITSIILVFILVLFGLNNIKAEEKNVEIKSIEIQEKSDNVSSNIEEDNELNYNMNLELYDIDDYITYRIIVKNNSDKDYEIDTITDNLESDYIESSYTTNKNEIKTGEEIELYLTLKYKESITTKKETLNHNLVITLKYTNGETSDISDIVLGDDTNTVQAGNTGSSTSTVIKIICYTIIIISIILLIVMAILRKKKLKSLGLLFLLLMIPTVFAEDNEGNCSLNISITLHSTNTATFKTGREVNLTMHKLAGAPDDVQFRYENSEYGDGIDSPGGYYLYSESSGLYTNRNIISIEKATEAQYDNVKDNLTSKNIVSIESSKYPIYMWFEVIGEYWLNYQNGRYYISKRGEDGDDGNQEYFEGGIIRWYSEADVVFLNNDASLMFFGLRVVKEIYLSDFDISSVTTMRGMFEYTGSYAMELSIEGLSDWNVSNVTDMSYMFTEVGYNATEWNIGDLSNWDTSSVTNMHAMFAHVGRNAMEWNIGYLSNWDVSKVTDMSWMFENVGYNATEWNIGNLSEWDVSNVTNMSFMFGISGMNATEWNIGYLSNWDVSNVISMDYMFYRAGANATEWNIGYLSNWDTSSVISMSKMFSGAGANAMEWNIGSLNIYATRFSEMFSSCPKANATLNIYNVSERYDGMFRGAATNYNSSIVVNYAPAVSSQIDSIIATKSSYSHIYKGSLIE